MNKIDKKTKSCLSHYDDSMYLSMIEEAKKRLRYAINYPTTKQGRRTDDGYPEEVCYDEYAYKRMVDSYRDALKGILTLLRKIK
jgi:hypothetical protein